MMTRNSHQVPLRRPRLGFLVIACLAMAGSAQDLASQQTESILVTKHNLSTSGPGSFKSTTEDRVCIFCHTPHRSRQQVPLWNRLDSTATYLTYKSTTFKGTVSQPNGSTKLCMSCHDGTIALGKVVSLNQEIEMLTGKRFLNTGRGFLGTNLQDDHPVSFPYSTSKGGSGIDYRAASAIVPPVRLDHNGLVQCTSCHDPHNNSLTKFLRTTDRNSALCLSCHDPREWNTASHKLSGAGWNNVGANPWPHAKYKTVAENGCANCHVSHGAGHPQRLLNFAVEEENCIRCHNGNVAAKNIFQDLQKISAHPVLTTQSVHDAAENPLTMGRHSECQDCHNPHAARAGTVAAPGVPGPLVGISGLNSSGAVVERINFGFELCYKCHADRHGTVSYVPRQITQLNTRLEFNPANPSFHPIEAPGRNPNVPSLLPPWTTASRVACTDCHNSDSSPAGGGTGPNGPHGSIHRPLLVARYDTTDNQEESPARYALCYKCHNRESIRRDESFAEHKEHIWNEDAACSTCHDSHGISSTQGNSTNNSHLINFNRSVVSPSPTTGELKFVDTGTFSGSCTLLCHGEDHVNKTYSRN